MTNIIFDLCSYFESLFEKDKHKTISSTNIKIKEANIMLLRTTFTIVSEIREGEDREIDRGQLYRDSHINRHFNIILVCKEGSPNNTQN